MKLLLEHVNEPGVQEQIEKIMRSSKEQHEHELSEAKQQEVMQHLIQNAGQIDISSLIRRTIASIQQVVGSMYDEKQIEKACKEIAAGVEASSIDESKFTQRVLLVFRQERLGSQRQKRASKEIRMRICCRPFWMALRWKQRKGPLPGNWAAVLFT